MITGKLLFVISIVFNMCAALVPIFKNNKRYCQKHSRMMQLGNVDIFKGVMLPLCLEETSVIDEATAGMSPDEITNYISNVGGELCGYPEVVKNIVGLSLNVNLIIFGVLTIAYVILGAINFILEKQVEDILKDDKPQLRASTTMGTDITGLDASASDTQSVSTGPNRRERRLNQMLNKDKKD